jgi:peptide/nickel transport system permease protein
VLRRPVESTFYTSGLSSPDSGHGIHFLIDRVQHLAIPAMTLTLLTTALYSRYMRAAMLEVINADYVRTARAKGLDERRVVLRHTLRNALIPLITVSALNISNLLAGALVTETVFQLDGMGPYLVQNLLGQDSYSVMAWLMVTGTIVILFNLVADVAYGYLDPRIRAG